MISYLATAALLVTGVVSQISVTSYTTCMTCVSVEGSWNLSTKKCETRNYDSSVVYSGSGCYKNNIVPTYQSSVAYDKSTDFSDLMPISASLNSQLKEIYISYSNMQSSPLTFTMTCSGNALYVYSYTGAIPDIKTADFDC